MKNPLFQLLARLEIAALENHQYTNALPNMAELLTAAAIRPPVVASAINSGGSLEQRLKMMITEKTWKISCSLRMAIVAFATCVFPLGFVHAQDFKAVEQRLGGAVEAGELSLEQAKVMMDALRRSGSQGELAAKKQRYLEIARKIEAAVEAGDLSTEEAEKKLIAVRHDMFEQGDDGDHKDSRMEAKKRTYMEAAEKIEAEVKTGALTKEAAKDRLVELKKRLFSDGE